MGRSGRVRPLHGPVLSPRPLRQHQEQSRYGRSFVFFFYLMRFAVDFILLMISWVGVLAGPCSRIHDLKLKER